MSGKAIIISSIIGGVVAVVAGAVGFYLYVLRSIDRIKFENLTD